MTSKIKLSCGISFKEKMCVSFGSPESIYKYGTKSVRYRLGKTPVKDKSGRSRNRWNEISEPSEKQMPRWNVKYQDLMVEIPV